MRTGRLKQIPIQDSFIAIKIRAKEGKIKKMRKVFKKKIRADANEQKKFKKHPKKVREASSVIDEDIEDLLKEYGESSDELIVNLYPRKKQPQEKGGSQKLGPGTKKKKKLVQPCMKRKNEDAKEMRPKKKKKLPRTKSKLSDFFRKKKRNKLKI